MKQTPKYCGEYNILLSTSNKNKKNNNHLKQNGVFWGRAKQTQILAWLKNRIEVGINLDFVRKIYFFKGNVRIATGRKEIEYVISILVEESKENKTILINPRKGKKKRSKENSCFWQIQFPIKTVFVASPCVLKWPFLWVRTARALASLLVLLRTVVLLDDGLQPYDPI